MKSSCKALVDGATRLTAGLVMLAGSVGAQTSGSILDTYILPDTPIGAFQNARLPGTITNDRGILLGSIGSGLWRSREHDPDGIYWMITDRGPNANPTAGFRPFPIETFTPFILKIKTEAGAISILEAWPLTGASGAGITGLPNLPGTNPVGDENPSRLNSDGILCSLTVPILRNVHGVDSEDLIRMKDGTFWAAEEYSSLLKIGPTGQVLMRFTPAGVTLPTSDYPSVQALPAAYIRRTRNRGFEGIALSPDDKTVFLALQSPLQNAGNNFFNTRILAFDTKKEKASGEWVYRFDEIGTFTAGSGNPESMQSQMKVSAVAAIDEHTLLVLERTDFVAKIYRVDTRGATDILGTVYDGVNGSLESFSVQQAADAGITFLPKELVVNLESIPGIPDKVEGLTIIGKNTIAISNDNDFSLGGFAADCSVISPTAVKNHVLVIRLEQSLW